MSSELEFRYTVFAYSSFHLMGDAEKYRLGEFDDCASAVAACEKVIDDFLLSIREGTSSPETLLEDLRGMFQGRGGLTEVERCLGLNWIDGGALDEAGNPPVWRSPGPALAPSTKQ